MIGNDHATRVWKGEKEIKALSQTLGARLFRFRKEVILKCFLNLKPSKKLIKT